MMAAKSNTRYQWLRNSVPMMLPSFSSPLNSLNIDEVVRRMVNWK